MVEISNHRDIDDRQELVTSSQLRKRMNWTHQALKTMIQKGLPHYRPGKLRYYSPKEVNDWLKQFARGSRGGAA